MNRGPVALLATFLAALAWSAYRPHDPLTWGLEVAPALLAVALLVATYRRFRFTPLAYTLMWLHALLLLVGGHYTYAEVPLFNWLRDAFDLSRNHYDRLGHLAQGFVPAIVAREVLLRTSPLRSGGWLFFLVTCVCGAVSAVYELLEWVVAEAGGATAEAFLAFQGDVWDTQKDMALALAAAVAAQLLLAGVHDRQLRQVLHCSAPDARDRDESRSPRP